MVSKGFCRVLWCFRVREVWFCGSLDREVSVMSEDIVCEVLFCQCVMGCQSEVVSVWLGWGMRGFEECDRSMMS